MLSGTVRRTLRRERATRPRFEHEFPFPNKHLRRESETKPVHLRHPPSHPCRELSKYREVSVDNAVSAITDSGRIQVLHLQDTPRSGGRGKAVRHGSNAMTDTCRGSFLAAARNEMQTAPKAVHGTGTPAHASDICNLHCFAGFGCHPIRKQGRSGASVPPAGYFRVNDRTTRTERDTRSHRKVSRHQQAGQRPARRNIGWHLMPMY